MSRTFRFFILVAVVLAVIMVSAVIVIRGLRLNRIVIHNAGAGEVREIDLTLRDLDGRVVLYQRIPHLQSGETQTFRHSANDVRVDLRFALAGQPYAYRENYVDLWTGEEWIYEIDDDGGVRSGYDRSALGHPLSPAEHVGDS